MMNMRNFLVPLCVLLVIFAVGNLQAQGAIQIWDFEDGLGNWASGAGAATIELSTEQALSDSQSVKMVGKDDHAEINIQNDAFDDVQEGDVLTFNVYISSADLALVNGLQIFFHDNAWGWVAGWTNGGDLTGDAWNMLTYQLPAFAGPPQRIGLQVLELDAASTVTVYIDDVSVKRAGDAGIVVDGMKDAFYDGLTGPDDGYLQLQAFHGNNNGFADNNEDLSAKIWVAWDDSCFYYFNEVVDDVVAATSTGNAWQNDQFEIKVDPIPDGVVNTIVGVDFTALNDGVGASMTPAGGVRKLTANGYVLEAAIPWSDLSTATEVIAPAVAGVFGLGMHNHDDDGATREATTQWAAVMLDQVWNTPAYLGTATFLADNKVQLVATNNFTPENTNDLPYDGTVPTTIAIDGEKDPFYYTLTGPDDGHLVLQAFHGNNNGFAVGNADLSSKVWTAWDNDNFYIYQEVTDDTISMSSGNTYQNDGIEIKVDPEATDSVANSIISFDMTAMDTTGGVTGVATIDSSFRTLTADGYVIEAAIPWTDMVHTASGEAVAAAEGNVFGMALNVHDNDNTVGARDGSVQWAAVMLDQVWNTPKYAATVQFLADNKLQLIPSNNMTGETNDLPYDGTVPPIMIDGEKDPFYHLLTGPDDGYLQLRYYHGNNNGFADDDDDLSAKIWAGWDDDFFYIYQEVTDDTISMSSGNTYQNDGIEIKVDPQATDSVANSIISFDMTSMDTTGGVTGVATIDSSFRKLTADGYVIEAAIPWTDMVHTASGEAVAAAVGNVFGAALNVHDNDNTTGARDASVQWAAVMMDQVWNTPKYCGTVVFLDDNMVQFDPTNNMTGVTNDLPYDGSDYTPSAVDDGPRALPQEFTLEQNYPNPFNPTTTISYSIPKASDVQLVVYDVLGREVMSLVNEKKEAGSYHVNFDGMNVSSGVYFYRLKAGDHVQTQKMMLLK